MAKRSKPVSVTELRANAGRVMRRAKGSHEPERELLRSIRRGQREIAAGRFFTLDQVTSDARKVLKRAQK
jgi:hypothetical protein